MEQLKRELAVPGAFAAAYPNTTEDDLIGMLADAVGSVQLIGFLPTSVLDVDASTVTPDLSPAARALVVIFAADRVLTMRLLDTNQRSLYEAGPVKVETEKAASMLTEILKGLRLRRQEILDVATGVGRSRGGFAMADMYGARSGQYAGVSVLIAGHELDFYVHELAY